MRKMTETETMNTNGGLLGWIAIGIGAAIIVAGGIKAYNDRAMEDVNDAFCDTFGKPLPFKTCE